MKTISKAVAFAMYMAVVYHALSSHDEKPVMVSRPTKDREEAEALAAELGSRLDPRMFSVAVLGIKGGQSLEAIFASLEHLKSGNQVQPEQAPRVARVIEPD